MEIFVARQPIFDLEGEVAGYELLYRRTAESRFADGSDSDQMSVDVVIQSFLEVGLEKITRGKPAFINFGREMLLGGSYELIDPSNVVVELLEDVPVDTEVTGACERLVRSGYRLALDDFIVGGPHEELVRFADIVKVDVLNRLPGELATAVQPLLRAGVRMLAEKVETSEVHEECRSLGFELFQGYFYSRPEMMANQATSVDQMTMIRLVSMLGSDRASDQDVEEAFRRDPTLSYKLLRMLNAAAHRGRGIESIRYAIRLVGRGTLQRWIALLLASSFAGGGGVNVELVHAAVLRARFCELLGKRTRRSALADSLFLVGLFSLMDSLIRIPMEEVLQRVDLAPAVGEALLRSSGPHADYLRVVVAYERGQWDEVARRASRIGLSTLEIPDLYVEALEWAREQLHKAL